MGVLFVQNSTTGIVPNYSKAGIGMTQQMPVQIYINTNDTLATVTTAGYLNKSVQDLQVQYNNYMMALVYTSDVGCCWLRVSVTTSGTTHTYSLVTPSEGSGSFSSLTLGNGAAATPSLNFASDVTTGLYRSGSQTIGFAANGTTAATLSGTTFNMLGNIQAGASGTAGTVSSFPGTAAKGSLKLAAVANTGNTVTTISNAAMGQASTISIPDPAGATANFALAPSALVSGNVVKASGTAGLLVDAGYFIKAAVTGTYAGGGTSNAFTATGLTATSIVTATIATSTNAVAIAKAVPSSNTLTVTFTADPGANTTVYWIATSAAV